MIDLNGTYRANSAEKTIARITPLLKRFGITRVADITGLDCVGVHVYQSIRPFAKSLSLSQGKGTSKELAQISAIMESIESWHAENINPPDLYGSYSELCSEYNLIWPEHLSYGPFISKNPAQSQITWIKTINLQTCEDVYIPYTLIHLDFTHFPPGFDLHLPSSNGLASGNTLEEALCHGLFELIERDAWVKAYRKIHTCFPIDLKTIECSYIQTLIDKIEKHNLLISLYDITSNIEIPTYAAFLIGTKEIRHTQNSVGFGTHFSKETAISRAITECLQARLTHISGARDDLDESDYQERKHIPLNNLLTIKDLSTFVPTKLLPNSFSDCLKLILDHLNMNNYKQILFYNHTKNEIGIPVVHVVIPGLLS